MTAMYRYYDRHGRLLYVGSAGSWLQRLDAHRYGPWFRYATSLVIEHHPTLKRAVTAEREAIRSEWPLWNVQGSPCESLAKALLAAAEDAPLHDFEHRRHLIATRVERCVGGARPSRLDAAADRQDDERRVRGRLMYQTTRVGPRPRQGADA